MRDLIDLQNFWRQHAGEKLVLATLIRKQGSSYRTPGAKKIISLATGQSCGLLSGGCLENDIVETAQAGTGDLPFTQSFSTLDEADRLLGYQTGCAGVIEILFEALPVDPKTMDLYLPFGPECRDAAGIAINTETATRRFVSSREAAAGDFFDPWITPITLTIIGCGIDAVPFAELVAPLGWDLRFVDYRPPSWSADITAETLPLGELGVTIPDDSAAVLMTHNYEADLEILRQLAPRNLAYLGCLGPAARFKQLQDDLQKLHGITLSADFISRVAAPAGLWPKGRTPVEIALSIVAQIHERLGHAV